MGAERACAHAPRAPQHHRRLHTQHGARPPVARRRLSREDYELLPHRIILLRHAESKGNVDRDSYSRQPDHTVPLTDRGKQHARVMGQRLQDMLSEQDGEDHRVFIMSSPYCRTLEVRYSSSSRGHRALLPHTARLCNGVHPASAQSLLHCWLLRAHLDAQTTDMILESFTDEQVRPA